MKGKGAKQSNRFVLLFFLILSLFLESLINILLIVLLHRGSRSRHEVSQRNLLLNIFSHPSKKTLLFIGVYKIPPTFIRQLKT